MCLESSQQRAKIDFWLSWHHHNTRNCTLKLFHPYIFRKMYENIGGYEKVFNPGLKSINKSFQYIENHFKNNNIMYLTGNNVTIADYMLLPEIDQLFSSGYGILPNFQHDYPYIYQWWNNCNTNISSYKSNYDVVAIAGQAYQERIAVKMEKTEK